MEPNFTEPLEVCDSADEAYGKALRIYGPMAKRRGLMVRVRKICGVWGIYLTSERKSRPTSGI